MNSENAKDTTQTSVKNIILVALQKKDAKMEMNATTGMPLTYVDSLQTVILAPGRIVISNTIKIVPQHGTIMITIMIFSHTTSNTGCPDNNIGVPNTTGNDNNSANTTVNDNNNVNTTVEDTQ